MTRVCFFGGYDRAYPRNRILMNGLERAGVGIIEARVPEHRAWRRYPALITAFARAGIESDVLFVPSFRHKDVPLARLLAGRRPLVFDPLVSRWDTLVGDWEKHAPGSGQARWNRSIDARALALPDLVLCDTWAHGALYESLGARGERIRRVLVGAEDEFFAVGPPPASEPVRVVYVGGFLPLHGVPTIIEAVARLERECGKLPAFTVRLVGSGMRHEQARDLARSAALARLELAGPCRYEDAPGVLADAHVVLGAFGTTEKAGRVIPHKVYQGLAAGRAVVTGDGPGVREVFEPGVHLLAVPRGDAAALAQALARVIADPALRASLGQRGRERAAEVGTPERIGRELARVLEQAIPAGSRRASRRLTVEGRRE